jgi:hypothetical protein
MMIKDERYFCFGCGIYGDAIDYIQQRDQVDFMEACKHLGWKGERQDSEAIQKAKIERMVHRAEADKTRALQLDKLLAEYTLEEIWLSYQRRMTHDHRAWWESQGIDSSWQNYLRLGYTPDRAYYDKDGALKHSPAYTIPYFHANFTFQNMQYRLQDPANPKDRYRFEHGLKTTYYMVTPSEPLQDHVIICEGAKKAIVCKAFGDTGDGVTLLAVPSKVDFGGVAEAVKDCIRVWVVLDPDSFTSPANAPVDWTPSPIKLAHKIGKAARVVRLPFKVDDGFTQIGMNADEWKATLKAARNVL